MSAWKRIFLLKTIMYHFQVPCSPSGVDILIEGSCQDRMLAMCRGYLRNLRLMPHWDVSLGFESQVLHVAANKSTSLTIEVIIRLIDDLLECF